MYWNMKTVQIWKCWNMNTMRVWKIVCWNMDTVRICKLVKYGKCANVKCTTRLNYFIAVSWQNEELLMKIKGHRLKKLEALLLVSLRAQHLDVAPPPPLASQLRPLSPPSSNRLELFVLFHLPRLRFVSCIFNGIAKLKIQLHLIWQQGR